jgi:hypothetical protein
MGPGKTDNLYIFGHVALSLDRQDPGSCHSEGEFGEGRPRPGPRRASTPGSTGLPEPAGHGMIPGRSSAEVYR